MAATAALRRNPEDELREAMAGFRHDPLGFVLFAFPWGEVGTELAGESGPRKWQIDTLTLIGREITDGDIQGANLPTGHRGTVRTALPIPTWRRINQGVDPVKSSESQVTDTCGMQTAYAVVDKALADLNGNSAAWRFSRNKA